MGRIRRIDQLGPPSDFPHDGKTAANAMHRIGTGRNRFGFVRITSASTKTVLANPEANAGEVIRVLAQVPDSDVVLFPELGVTGYSCADLFGQSALLDAGIRAVERIADATRGREQLVVVGLPEAPAHHHDRHEHG